MEDAVTRCVRAFKPHHRKHGELEFRLGSVDEERFSSGVSREIFEQLERDMSDELLSDKLWTEIVDYYYLDASGATLRTRVTFDNRQMRLNTEHIRKEVLTSVLVCRDDDPGDACRISCSIEHPIDEPPVSVMINYVRVKQRKRFVDMRNGGEVWVFELSKTWSAGSRDAVEYQQHNTEPNYEVECELVDSNNEYLCDRTDVEVTESILMKIKMLLGEDVDGRISIVGSDVRGKRKRARKTSE